MKDEADKITGDLAAPMTGAQRQAALEARRAAQGFKRRPIWVRQADFDRGVNDAKLGSTNASKPPAGVDRLSWTIGYATELDRADKAREAHLAKLAAAAAAAAAAERTHIWYLYQGGPSGTR